MATVQNLTTFDPFKDAEDGFVDSKKENLVHIRIQKRNGRKSITTIQGMADDLDLKKLLKAFRKEFACNGTLLHDEEMGEIIQLQGDQRQNVFEFLIEEEICKKSGIKIHGF
eukprot:TRINITY_DN4400_c0_g1_i1.p1 TRINITY_DN4400_c0_g1~~TRINITY_DN4400_c0_g1_i1.p1  ORF type:complete len:126 (+),score=22.22 TRINITY_DN4400_c0_g1_i1:44-379(+)